MVWREGLRPPLPAPLQAECRRGGFPSVGPGQTQAFSWSCEPGTGLSWHVLERGGSGTGTWRAGKCRQERVCGLEEGHFFVDKLSPMDL